MSTKVFISLVIGVLVLGVGIGGSFLGGLAVGKSQEAEAAAAIAPLPQAPTLATQPSEETAGQTFAQLREQLLSEDLSQEELAELRHQFQDGDAGGFGGFGGGRQRGGFGGFGGGGGLIGTIESVEGTVVTLNTAEGTLRVSITDETTIQKTIQLTAEDLVEGERLTVVGSPGADGVVEATSMFVIPEGQTGGFGGGGFGEGGFGGGG